jgi:hypothetical protein
MPDIGKSNPGQIGGGDWLERVKEFGRMVRSWGVFGKSEVTHESQAGEGRFKQSMRSVGGGIAGRGSVTERGSEYVATQGTGRVARILGDAEVSVTKLGGDAEGDHYVKEMRVIGQFLERLQTERISPSEVRRMITIALNDPSLNLIDALNHLGREGRLDEVLDVLPISSVVLLGVQDEELAEHVFGKLQPVTWDAFEERRWAASEDEGFGGAPIGGDEGVGGYLQHRIDDLNVTAMSPEERANVETEFRDINATLYEVFNS